MLAGALMIQSALSVLHAGGAITEEAYLSLERGLLLMGVDKNHEVCELIKKRVHHSIINNATHRLVPKILYEEFATVEYVMES
ncbi:MAG: hypothetical protein WC708_00995 [Lentisphaeria bacterium]|jgi:hypothetical protein